MVIALTFGSVCPVRLARAFVGGTLTTVAMFRLVTALTYRL